MLIQRTRRLESKGCYNIPTGALVWGAVFSLAAYLGVVAAKHRDRHVIERHRQRDHRDRNENGRAFSTL